MTSDLESALRAALSAEVRFDAYSRHLYSTDASLYAVEPLGVVFPRHADDVVASVEIARRFGAPVLARGAGTSLAGQTVGRAIVLDFSRYMHALVELDPRALRARVQPGLVQDDLNRAASKHNLFFAPDTSTSNRATLGGMIGNNSCGARSARYGMTIDHVESLDVVLSDGSRAVFSALGARTQTNSAAALAPAAQPPSVAIVGETLEQKLDREIPWLVAERQTCIRRDMPAFWRRSGGYRLERMLPESGPFNLANLVVGSEGTLAIVVEATVKLVVQPAAVVSVAGHFTSVDLAITAAESARASGASAIELIDRFIISLAHRSALHAPLAAMLQGDPGAVLFVEFSGDSRDEALEAATRFEARWRDEGHAYATLRANTAAELKRFRELRKAGLGLLTAAGEGGERSIAFVEDTAVDPARLGEYSRRFAQLLKRRGLQAGFYGHASAGCLHIRPFIDIAKPGEVARVREIAEEVCGLVMEFGGMNSSEHGDGLVRSEFNRRFFGTELYDAMVQVKRLFDPENRFNPGKKVDATSLTEHLRDPALSRALPLVTHFAFAGVPADTLRPAQSADARAGDGMRQAANRCARIGECRKGADAGGVMCPSFMATRDEQHSTRGRANALVHALSSPDPAAALGDDRLHEILDLCLECKACKSECPMSVDMAALKAEVLAHAYEARGVPLGARLFGNARSVNRVGSAFAPLSNWLAALRPTRALLERIVGIDQRRRLPRFARESLQQWFARRSKSNRHVSQKPRGRVAFLADSFTSYTEPHIGRAAIELLELAGHEVEFVADLCCGRSLISKGLLHQATARHTALIDRLAPLALKGIPIVGVEPSCVFTLKDELVSLARGSLLEGARAIAARTSMVEDLLVPALDDGALTFRDESAVREQHVLFHAHCHQKAANAASVSVDLLTRIPGARVDVLDAGCCGMAGSFGFERAHYDLSMRIAGMRLFPALDAAPDAVVAATGVSCRGQVEARGRKAQHPLELCRVAAV